MSDSFYKILGVPEKATKEEIKKAYRVLSLKHHPDRNQNSSESKKMFQEIGEAYETLSDEKKRQEYDMRNNNPFFKMAGGNAEGMDIPLEALFQSFFSGPMMGGMPPGMMGGMPPGMMSGMMGGMPGMMGGMMGGMPNSKIHVFTTNGFGAPQGFGSSSGFGESLKKPIPIIKTLEITMSDVLNGSKLPLDIERWSVMENDIKVFEKETLYINIPKGSDDNEIIVLREKGNIISENLKGDVKIFIKVINNSCFERKGLDLFMSKTISLKESLCGFNFEIDYINGKSYTLNNNSGNIIPPNYKKILKNMGLTRDGNTGNLIIHFHVEFPEKLSEEKLKKISEIL